jgi:putative acetyltransferase
MPETFEPLNASFSTADAEAPLLALQIRVDTLEGGEVISLLEEHLREMQSISPPKSIHALDPAALRKPGLTFWSAWFGHELAGCGALRELTALHGEIKSMRTSAPHRRKGVASAILDHIIAEATRRGYERLSLETGSKPQFEAARQLYASYGFEPCGPFEGYIEDPYSTFMTKRLNPADA